MLPLTREALLVRDALLVQGLETPLACDDLSLCGLNNQIRESRIAEHILSIMHLLNLDLKNDSIVDTPSRVAKMYIREIFFGLDYSNFPKITVIENKIKMREMIIIRAINLTSICEHHFIIFDGVATIAYIPREYIVGLSKVHRIVQFFSKRPQLQERLTKQIFLALQVLLATEDVAIFIDALHYCIKARGVRDINSSTITTSFGGLFKSNESIRHEFFEAITYYNS